jgi:hypothetical protein
MKNLLLGIFIGAIATLLIGVSLNWKDVLRGAITFELPEMQSGEVTVTLPPDAFDFKVTNPPVKVEVTVPKASVTTLPPTVVYVADTTAKNKPNDANAETVTITANNYLDTMRTEVGTFYSSIITDGTLLKNSFSYELKPITVPDYWRVYGVGSASWGDILGGGIGVGAAAFKGRYGFGYDLSYFGQLGSVSTASFFYLLNQKKDLKPTLGKEDF